jgi:hypothetical protein
MNWTIIFIVAVGMGLVRFWLWFTHPSPKLIASPQDVIDALRAVLQRGANGGRARFRVRDTSSASLDFVKYIKAQNDVGLRTTMRRDGAMTEAFGRVVKELDERSVRYTQTRGPDGVEEIAVDFGRDLGLAQLFCRLVFITGVGISMQGDLAVSFDLVLNAHDPSVTGVDSPSAF